MVQELSKIFFLSLALAAILLSGARNIVCPCPYKVHTGKFV